MVCDGNPGNLDFQCTVACPLTCDLASLLEPLSGRDVTAGFAFWRVADAKIGANLALPLMTAQRTSMAVRRQCVRRTAKRPVVQTTAPTQS
jgi:hypothetical protein